MMNLLNKYREQITYLFFGGLTTAVSWGTHLLLYAFGAHDIAISVIPTVIAIAFAFFTNRCWVFRSEVTGFKNICHEAFVFAGSRAVMGVFESVSVFILPRLGFDGIFFNVEGFDARILASVVVVIGNYFISKFLVFKKKPEEDVSNENQ